MNDKKIILGIFLGGATVVGLLFFMFQTRVESLSQEKKSEVTEAGRGGDGMLEESKDAMEDEELESEEEYQNGQSESSQPPVYLEISPKDCQKECEAFSGNDDHLRYCRSYCGFSAVEGEAPQDAGSCEAKTGVARDSCIKDEAVKNQDLERCEDIRDQNLKKSCQARVTEEYFP